MRKRIRYWDSGLSALCLIVPAVIAVILSRRYSRFYQGIAVAPPTLTHWALEAYPYTPLFLLWLSPIFLLSKSTPDARTRQITLVATTTVVLAVFALWLAFLWLGIYMPIHDLNTVVGSG